MGIVVQQGSVNTAALVDPGLYIGIIPPQPTLLNGVPTNIAGFVGNASYGPVNTPMPWQDYASFSQTFGPLLNRTGDLGTHVSIAVQQGCANGYAVRVTDGTDVAATGKFGISSMIYAVLLTAKYTGSAGNGFTATIKASQYPGAMQLVLTSGLGTPEVFDNLPVATPGGFWAAIVNAVNNGTSTTRPKSSYFLATIGTNTTATVPTAGTVLTLTGGTDGVTSLTNSVYIGTDGVAGVRTGMYALRGTGCSAAALCDVRETFTFPGGGSAPTVSSDVWIAQLAFGLSERIYMISQGAPGDAVSNWVGYNAPGIAGAQGYGLKCMFGDWPSWQDNVNNIIRMVAPAPFVVGRLCNQSPALSALNQQLYGIVGSQFYNSGAMYGVLDVNTLIGAGFDVITPPGQGPGGQQFWTCATGISGNPNPAAQGDNYTTMTNFIVNTLAAGATGLGQFIGQLITAAQLQTEQDVLDSFFQNLQDAGLIGNSGGGKAFQNQVTSSPTQLQNGIVVISSMVVYLAVQRFLVVQLQGGQTVSIQVQSAGPGQ